MKPEQYTILAIETSLDDTCAAVTIDDRIISNVVSSQIDLHKKWGGVVPIIAKRAHEKRIDRVIKEAVEEAVVNAKRLNLDSCQGSTLSISTVDAIAVTLGPGQ